MGKRIDQLNLDDSGPGGQDDLLQSRRRADRLLSTVNEMLESGDYDFAWGFLKDLSLTLEQRGVCTSAQEEAVANVQKGQERQEQQRQGWERHERRTGRRYDGWDGRNK